jgi:flagellar protein FliO/FliZ
MFKMLSSLAVVLAGIVAMLLFTRRFLRHRSVQGRDSLIRVLASSSIGLKKSIALVEVPGTVLVLGVTGERISLLSRIEDPEQLARIEDGSKGKAPVSFLEQLQLFSARWKGFRDVP